MNFIYRALCVCVKTYFEEHEELRTNSLYIRLFPQLARQTHQVAPTHTSAPSNSHNTDPQLEISNRQNIQNGGQPSHAQGNIPVHPMFPYHLNRFLHCHPGYIAHHPSYNNVNTYHLGH